MSRVLSEIIRPGRVGLGSQVTVPVYTSRGYNAGDYVYLHPDGTVGSKGTYGYLGEDLTYCGWLKRSSGRSAQTAESVSYGPMQDYGTYTGATVSEGTIVTNNVALNAEGAQSYRTAVLTNGNLVSVYNLSATATTLKFIINTSAAASVVAATTITTTLNNVAPTNATGTFTSSFDVITVPDVGFLVAWATTSPTYAIFWRLYDDSGNALEEFTPSSANTAQLNFYFTTAQVQIVRMANLGGTDVVISAAPGYSDGDYVFLGIWGKTNRADGVGMKLNPTNSQYGWLTLGAAYAPSNGYTGATVDFNITTFPSEFSGSDSIILQYKTTSGIETAQITVDKIQIGVNSPATIPYGINGTIGVFFPWATTSSVNAQDYGGNICPLPFPSGSIFVTGNSFNTSSYKQFPRRSVYVGNNSTYTTLALFSNVTLGNNNGVGCYYNKQYAIHPLFNNYLINSGANGYTTSSAGLNIGINKSAVNAQSPASGSTYAGYYSPNNYAQGSTPLTGFATIMVSGTAVAMEAPKLNIFRDRLYGTVYKGTSNYLYLSTVSNLTATNGSTLLYGKRYSPEYGYYLIGVAATSAAAGATGQVIINGEATLNSSYPAVSNSLSFSYDAGGYGTLGQKGRVSGRNVTLQGVEE